MEWQEIRKSNVVKEDIWLVLNILKTFLISLYWNFPLISDSFRYIRKHNSFDKASRQTEGICLVRWRSIPSRTTSFAQGVLQPSIDNSCDIKGCHNYFSMSRASFNSVSPGPGSIKRSFWSLMKWDLIGRFELYSFSWFCRNSKLQQQHCLKWSCIFDART